MDDVVTVIAVLEGGKIWGWKQVNGAYRDYQLGSHYYRRGRPADGTETRTAVVPRSQAEAWFRQWPMHPKTPGAPAYEPVP